MLADIRELIAHHELIANFAAREIKAKYKQALLGVSWALLQPLLQIAIMTLVFSYFARVPSDGVPYPLFLFSGFLPWLFFSGAVTRGVGSLTNLANLIKKVYFPRESLILAALVAAAVDFALASTIYAGMLAFYQWHLTWTVALLVPVLAVQLVLTLGLMLFLAPLNTYYRDVSQFIPVVLQLWMYLSAIMYPPSLVPEQYRTLFFLNPMAGLIEAYRAILLRGEPPDPAHVLYAALVGGILLVMGHLFFKRVEMQLADIS